MLGALSSAIDATEDLEESMPGPSHLSNVQSKEDQTDLESSSISHYDIVTLFSGQVHCLKMRR